MKMQDPTWLRKHAAWLALCAEVLSMLMMAFSAALESVHAMQCLAAAPAQSGRFTCATVRCTLLCICCSGFRLSQLTTCWAVCAFTCPWLRLWCVFLLNQFGLPHVHTCACAAHHCATAWAGYATSVLLKHTSMLCAATTCRTALCTTAVLSLLLLLPIYVTHRGWQTQSATAVPALH